MPDHLNVFPPSKKSVLPVVKVNIMKYQLVLQFPENLYGDLDWVIAIEDRLIARLVEAEVDGHDMGNGEVNIFILTNNPVATFELVKNILQEEKNVLENTKAAYRNLGGNSYICLWPSDLTNFNVT